MKKETLRIAVLFVLLVAASALNAQAQTARTVVAQIPFDFVVGNETLPAGEYVVGRATHNSASCLVVTSADGRRSALVLTDATAAGKPAAGKAARAALKLDFHRYGDQYFLAQVWNGDSHGGRRLAVSRRERVLRRELSPKSASGSASPQVETISVTAVIR